MSRGRFNLLIKKEVINENDAKFYLAEMVLAVDAVHKLNCIHRDLKPDNILIDKNGHLKLSDFGLCKMSEEKMFPFSSAINDSNRSSQVEIKGLSPNRKKELIKIQRKNRVKANSIVGTGDYIAPEVYGGEGYGCEVDWWLLGVIFFEMIVGYPAFYSESREETKEKIKHWKDYFEIPFETNLSPEAISLLRGFITIPSRRLGSKGIEEIKHHPFFSDLDWDNIHKMIPPFVPRINSEWDNKYFDKFPEKESFYPPQPPTRKLLLDKNYAGYTFDREEVTKDGLTQTLEVIDLIRKSIENQKKRSKLTLSNESKSFTNTNTNRSMENSNQIIKTNNLLNISSNKISNSMMTKQLKLINCNTSFGKKKSISPKAIKKSTVHSNKLCSLKLKGTIPVNNGLIKLTRLNNVVLKTCINDDIYKKHINSQLPSIQYVNTSIPIKRNKTKK